MIVYDLLCECSFRFEGWFKDRDDFYSQKEKGLISCPDCDGNEITKILSPVSIKTKGNRNSGIELKMSQKELALHLIRGMQKYVSSNFEDVGSQFASEALKIHYGVEKHRNIRGVTTTDEERMLDKEGVDVVKLPFPLKGENDNEN